jgi:hypothetical protein
MERLMCKKEKRESGKRGKGKDKKDERETTDEHR